MKLLCRQVLLISLLALGLQGVAAAKRATVAAGGTKESCNWNRPGVNPFTGDVVAAVDRYTDIPLEVRGRLKSRMAKREYDDMVTIRRDGIAGRMGYEYSPAIRDMHFGPGKVCRTVTRKSWSSKTVERGLVYCDSGQCILVPTVCRNVSRIARRGVSDGSAGGDGGDGGGGGGGTSGDGGSPGAFGSGGAAADGPNVAALGGAPGGESTGAGASSTAAAAGGGASDGAAASAGSPASLGTGTGGVPGVIYGPGAGGGGVLIVPGTGPAVSAIPEPQTWALMLGGLGTLGAFVALARRRVRTPATA